MTRAIPITAYGSWLRSAALAGLLASALPGSVAVASAPSPPTAARIKKCIQQMDPGNRLAL